MEYLFPPILYLFILLSVDDRHGENTACFSFFEETPLYVYFFKVQCDYEQGVESDTIYHLMSLNKYVLRVPNECWPLSAWKIVVHANPLKMLVHRCILGSFICLNVLTSPQVWEWLLYIGVYTFFFLLKFRNEGLKSWTKCTLNNGSIWMKTSIQVLTANSFLLRMHFSVKMDHIHANKCNIVTMGMNFMSYVSKIFI